METGFPELLLIVGVVLLLAGTGFFFWYRRLRRAQRAVSQCNALVVPIIAQMVPEPQNQTPAHQAWLDILQENALLAPLYGSGSMVILGTAEMGLSTVLGGIVKKINDAFPMSRRMAVYVDAASLQGVSTTIENCFPEEIYRLVISQMVDPLLMGLQERLGKSLYQASGLKHLDNQIKALCDNSIVEMPTAAIGETLVALWKAADIAQVKLCLDNVSAVDPHHLPHLLHLLMRTFETAGRADLVIGGNLEQLKLIIDTPEGPVGIQFGHDIFLGLNLQDLLLPSSDQLQGSTPPDVPRAQWIERLLNQQHPEARLTFAQFQHNCLAQPGLWVLPFHRLHGNLDRLRAVILKTQQQYLDTQSRLSEAQLEALCQ